MKVLLCLAFGAVLLFGTFGQETGDVEVAPSAIGLDPDNQVPPSCLESSDTSECVNERDFLRVLASDNANACNDIPFTASATKDVIAESVIRCLNGVRVQPELLQGTSLCDTRSFEGELLDPRRSPLRDGRNENSGSGQPLGRSAMGHSSSLRSTMALGLEGSNGTDFVKSIASTGWSGFPVAQAVARGSASARAFVLGWMCSESNRKTLMSCAFDTIGAGASNIPGTSDWYITVHLGCSAVDGDCRCSKVEVVQSPPPVLAPLSPPGEGSIQEQSVLDVAPEIGEPAIAGDPAGVVSPACIFATTPDCVNPNSLVATQATIDIDQACPDVRLYGSGISFGEVTNQIEACINAYRVAPNAFESVLPCAYTFREEVTFPPRTPLKVTAQSSDDPIHPLDVSSTGHSRDMANRDCFKHDSLDGRSFSDRIIAEGWTGYPLGENIAAGYQTVRATVLGWVCSSGHRRNLMSCGFDIMGTGVAFNSESKFKYYYTQNFGCGAPGGECKCGETLQANAPRAAQTPPQAVTPPPPTKRSTPVRLPAQSPRAGQGDVPDAPTRDTNSVPDARTRPLSPQIPSGGSRTAPRRPSQPGRPRRQRGARRTNRRDRRKGRQTAGNTSAQDPFQELFALIETSPNLSGVLTNADVANVFIRRGVGRQRTIVNIFGQSVNTTVRSDARVVGDPLVWMTPAREKVPPCFVFPGEECAGDVHSPPELIDPEEVCSSVPFNGSDIDIANEVEKCANAYRVDPDAFASILPCEYTFRSDVLVPQRGPLQRVEQKQQPAEDPLDRASMIHSFDLATNDALLGHIDAEGKSVEGRLADQNVTASLVGELMSAGYESVQDAVLAWICSPPHRQVLMSCGFDSFGTGASMDKFSGLQTYITQTFACSRPDGECTCAPKHKKASEALPSRMMCRVGSSQDGRVEQGEQINGPHNKKKAGAPRGIMHTLNAAAVGEGCLPTTIESQLVIAIFFDKKMTQLQEEDFAVDMKEALELDIKPAEGKNGKVWLLRVTVSDSFFGLVEINMVSAQPTQTLRVKRVTEQEMLNHIIRSSRGERSCP